MRHVPGIAAVAVLAVSFTACGSSDSPSSAPPPITLVAYDSFPTKDTALNVALDEFTQSTGIKVTVARAGDAGTMLTKARLTAGNPEGDVMWGIDSTQLSAALEDDVFSKYQPNGANAIAMNLAALVPGHELTPVDYGDVCINYDKEWFADHNLTPPGSLADLAEPAYRDLLVVEDPSASSPGLAFLMATIAQFGDGWEDYWASLRANGVKVVNGWDAAYYEEFSGAAGSQGDRPLVVSYGSSPPAEVIFADPPRTDAPTAVIDSTCFRQVEFAGVLRGTKHEAEARQLVDFLISARFQSELPLTLFVYPARTGVALPEEFTKYTVVPSKTLSLDSATIAANRQKWQDEWTDIVLR
ncbi:MAG TPA: thiamine ABC transporter substrate-binding protein [Ilumatobacteraceae bacterium]|nr:thiamine ABC transporter substrate-binding protein [Ilumatobacteraceae bacterium]